MKFKSFYNLFLVSPKLCKHNNINNTSCFGNSLCWMSSGAKKKKSRAKVLSLETMNQSIKEAEFAVKGPVLLRAHKHLADMKQGEEKPFSEVIFTNQGDCHAMGQPPITFLRQVLATCLYPQLLQHSSIPSDVKLRVRQILDGCLGKSMGAYTDSQGIPVVRQHVADYIYARDDGIKADPQNIYLLDGVTPLVTLLLSLFVHDIECKPTGVMVPVPVYPLYHAVLGQLGLHRVDYYLDEDKNWKLDMKELSRAYEDAKTYCHPRVLVVINPGNPTGGLLKRRNIEDIIKFAHKHKLVLIADEVYQENVYDLSTDFHSIKKVKHELGPPYSEVELMSFISASKGFTGECGLRGGAAELDSFDKEVQAQVTKLASIALCGNSVGQACLSVICKPPQPGDESYEEFMREKCCILNGLAAKAKLVADKINEIPGLKVQPVQGALYALAKIDMPKSAIKAAERKNSKADTMWCYQLLDMTGITVVPGSGFGQKQGTYHFRTTILPPFETMEKVVKGIRKFHRKFIKRYK